MPSHNMTGLAAAGSTLAVLLFGSLPIPVRAADIKLTPSVEVTEEFSSNVDLEPPGQEDSALVTRATPGARLRARSARMDAAFDTGITFRHQTAGEDKGLTQDVNLTANGDFELARERLFLETGASVSQQVLSSRLANSAANQKTVQTYRLSPVLKSHLGGHATGEIRYALEQVFVSQGVSDQTTHRGSVRVESELENRPMSWALKGNVSQAVRSEDPDVSRAEAVASGDYAVTRWLHLLAEVGYQHFDDGNVTSFDAPVAVGGVRIRPERRSELEARVGRRNDSTYASGKFHYDIGPRTTLSLAYDETLSTSQERLANTVSALALDADRNDFIDTRTETPFNPKTDPFDIDNQTERIRTFTATLRRGTERTTIALSGSFAREEKEDSGEDQTNLRLDLNLTRRLSRKTTARAALGFERSRFDDGQTDNEYLANGSLSREIWRDVDIFLSYSFQTQDSTVFTSEFTEHRVLVGLRRKF